MSSKFKHPAKFLEHRASMLPAKLRAICFNNQASWGGIDNFLLNLRYLIRTYGGQEAPASTLGGGLRMDYLSVLRFSLRNNLMFALIRRYTKYSFNHFSLKKILTSYNQIPILSINKSQ